MPGENDYGYAAGLFDGEGCVATVKSRAGQVYAAIRMTDPRPLMKLQRMFGGRLAPAPRCGHAKRQMWHWRIWATDCERFFTAILPHCEAKRDEIELALVLFSLRKPRGQHKLSDREVTQRAELTSRIRLLKRREFAHGL